MPHILFCALTAGPHLVRYLQQTCQASSLRGMLKLGRSLSFIPEKKHTARWHDPVPIHGDRIFGVMTILQYMLRQVAPQSAWKQRFKLLLADYPDIPIRFMGFPNNWEESPLWQSLPLWNSRGPADP